MWKFASNARDNLLLLLVSDSERAYLCWYDGIYNIPHSFKCFSWRSGVSDFSAAGPRCAGFTGLADRWLLVWFISECHESIPWNTKITWVILYGYCTFCCCTFLLKLLMSFSIRANALQFHIVHIAWEPQLGQSRSAFGQQSWARERKENRKYSVFSSSIQTAPASPHRPH